MKNPTPYFPPLTPRQLSSLEDIEGLKAILMDFDSLPIVNPEIKMTLRYINELTANAARSGLIKKDAHGDYHIHPNLPPWAKKHFKEWVSTRLALGDWESLRDARIGLEAGLKRPFSKRQLDLKDEVLRLRGVKEENVSGEFGPSVRPEQKKKEQKKRVRKERRAWRGMPRQLIEKKLLKKPITPQGLKKKLKRLFPNIDWDKV